MKYTAKDAMDDCQRVAQCGCQCETDEPCTRGPRQCWPGKFEAAADAFIRTNHERECLEATLLDAENMLQTVRLYLVKRDEMNATMHLSQTRWSPLTTKVIDTLDIIRATLRPMEPRWHCSCGECNIPAYLDRCRSCHKEKP